MRVEDFAYRVAHRTMELLEQEQHYKINEEHRKAILKQIVKEVNNFLTAS